MKVVKEFHLMLFLIVRQLPSTAKLLFKPIGMIYLVEEANR
jgi:hypothetical protein